MNYLFNIYHVEANKKSAGMQFQKIVSLLLLERKSKYREKC